MGTRNLTAVYLDGQYKVAQYGQWDGYPEGQGITVLTFLRDKMDLELFKEALRNSSYIPSEELTALAENDRFYFLRDLEEDNGYHGVRLVAKWNLDALPTDEEFLAAFKNDEEEEETPTF